MIELIRKKLKIPPDLAHILNVRQFYVDILFLMKHIRISDLHPRSYGQP